MGSICRYQGVSDKNKPISGKVSKVFASCLKEGSTIKWNIKVFPEKQMRNPCVK